jgi:hypothetical protein
LTFKKAFPVGDLGQVSLALVGVYVVITMLFWPIPLILKLTGVEVYEISLMPYSILIPTWFMSAGKKLRLQKYVISFTESPTDRNRLKINIFF